MLYSASTKITNMFGRDKLLHDIVANALGILSAAPLFLVLYVF